MHKISMRWIYALLCSLFYGFGYASYAPIPVQRPVQITLREKLERAMFKHVVIPAYTLWNNLKQTELSYADVVAAGTVAGACYGLKKFNDKTHAITNGLTHGGAVGKGICSSALDNKVKTVVGASVLSALWYIYKLTHADAAYAQVSIEGFFRTLTKDQRASIVQSLTLTVLVQQARANPAYLLDNQEFMELLNQEQKNYLNKLVLLYDALIL